MITLERDYFLEVYKFINQDEYYNSQVVAKEFDVTAHTQDININKAYSNAEDEEFRRSMSKNGFHIFNFQRNFSHETILNWLTKNITQPIQDSSNNKELFSKIFATKGSKYFSNTNYTQPLHSDDAHIIHTPRTIALYCHEQADIGGITTLVNINSIIEKLKLDKANKLKSILLSPLLINGVQGQVKKPLLMLLENKTIGINFPAFAFNLSGSEFVIDTYKKINKLLHDVSNQIRFKLKPGELLMIDNKRVLHGRTKFAVEDSRVLYRFCFDKAFY